MMTHLQFMIDHDIDLDDLRNLLQPICETLIEFGYGSNNGFNSDKNIKTIILGTKRDESDFQIKEFLIQQMESAEIIIIPMNKEINGD